MDAEKRNQEEYKHMKSIKCKICRRLGAKLFLKGERCFSPKCAMIKRPYAPGQTKKNARRKNISEYGKEFAEKQKLRRWYGLSERQFAKYVTNVLDKMKFSKERSDEKLVRSLELRLDTTVYKMGLAESQRQSRILVSHNHILVNGKKANVPSYALKKGDVISVKPKSIINKYFINVALRLKKHQAPSWLKIDVKNIKGEIISQPTCEEVALPIKLSSIFEHYSK